MTRFAVWPGQVVSANDRDIHYLSAPMLLQLHGLPPGTRYVLGTSLGYRRQDGDVDLKPRYLGRYPILSAVEERHRPQPDHKPQPVLCIVCGLELRPVYEPSRRQRYWRHLRRRKGLQE